MIRRSVVRFISNNNLKSSGEVLELEAGSPWTRQAVAEGCILIFSAAQVLKVVVINFIGVVLLHQLESVVDPLG
jgi:hypothetical protein